MGVTELTVKVKEGNIVKIPNTIYRIRVLNVKRRDLEGSQIDFEVTSLIIV